MNGFGKLGSLGLICSLLITIAVAPVRAVANRAANTGEEQRVVSYYAVDRSEIENLQRWVADGHEEWCKDARLVAAEQLRRIAADFSGDARELQEAGSEANPSGTGAVTFDWAPLDGRALYRITVERFEWLLPIAKSADAMVWVPTATEIYLNVHAGSVEDQFDLMKA